MALRCIVVTPERTELDREAEFISLPMYDGELGVLKGPRTFNWSAGIRNLAITNRGGARAILRRRRFRAGRG